MLAGKEKHLMPTEDVIEEVNMPMDPKLINTASRKHGFETLGLKAVLWRILLRSAKIF